MNSTRTNSPGRPSLSGDPADLVMQSERWLEVHDALARLTEDQQRCVRLFYFDDCRYEEISKVLGVPINTVRRRLYHARQRLASELPPGYSGPAPS